MDLADAIAAFPPPRATKTAIAVPDGTRPVDVSAALLALRPYVNDAVVIVGLGLHRPMRREELPTSPFPLVQHDADDTIPTGLVDGIEGRVSAHVHGCDVILGVGIVELHQYAGFSGGHKAVSVGLGGRSVIDALHHRDRVTAPGVELGRLDGNPFRSTVDKLGEAAGCAWTLLTTGPRWFAGSPRSALIDAAGSLDCWIHVPRRYPAAILRVPTRKAANFYQASRAATYLALSPAPPLVDGATLYLDAACPEGMGEGSGEQAFTEILSHSRPPFGELLSGPAPTSGGTQRAIMLALTLRRFRLVVCGVHDVTPFRRAGIEATTEPADSVAPADRLEVCDPFGRIPILTVPISPPAPSR